MSPSGFYDSKAYEWYVHTSGRIGDYYAHGVLALRPVLNLKADTVVSGTGDSGNHWVVAN